MPSPISPQRYGQAVLQHVQSGSYPESEEVVAAEIPPSALPQISHLIEQAKEDLKIDIRKSSRDSAPDVDGWISQAKQLRVDIQKSQEIAREVIEQAQHGEHLEERFNDAKSKVSLLNAEISFNGSLRVILEQFGAIQRTLESVRRATLDGNLVEAVELLKQVDRAFVSLHAAKSTRISGILEGKVTELRKYVKEKLTDRWNFHILIDADRPSIRVRREAEGPSPTDLASLVNPLISLNCYEDLLQPLCSCFESLILLPRLEVHSDGSVNFLEVDGNEILVSSRSTDLSAQALFRDLKIVMDFLRTQLPPSVCEPLAKYLMPRLVSRLISTWLASAVPEDLDAMEDFEDTLNLVKEFGKALETQGWPGNPQLTNWIEGIPGIWLRKRRELSLDRVRNLFSRGLGGVETVERTETQFLSQNDEVFASNGVGDEWNAGWSDEETSPTVEVNPLNKSRTAQNEEEEDVSAWGLNDDKEIEVDHDRSHSSRDVGEEADAWGWGDEDEGEGTRQSSQVTATSSKRSRVNGTPKAVQRNEREVTLKETYTITTLPKEILQIISQVISDSIQLETPELASLPIASAASGLLSLPGLILAMYRASSSISYSRHSSGQMFIYNDSVWLAERLQNLDSIHTTLSGKQIPSRIAYNLKLKDHISALESFGKRAYAKEMESQRTIITDLLDGAQGFVHCTEHPFAGEADVAVASTIDRLRQLYKEWNEILSHSALLQSLGSLLTAIIDKVIIDVEDMPDISEPNSQQLSTYCSRIATLEDLFIPAQGAADDARNNGQEVMPMTALYTSHWLKFRYLENILESSLVDIKYLWTEGELGLEFDTEELVDLVVALFADSPHRRTAVAEIRGRKGVR